MSNIENYSPSSGRMLKEDNTYVNIADLIEIIADGISPTPITHSILASGKATATTSNQVITTLTDFNNVSVKNDGTTEIKFAINENSTTSTKIIYVKAGESWSGNVTGDELNYSVVSGTAEFRYVLIGGV